MKHSKTRLLSLLLVLAMAFAMLPVSAFAEGTATYTKVDVASAADITAGTYLIYGISSQVTDDGTGAAFMSAENSTDKRLMSSDLAIESGTVTTDDAYSVWNLTEADGGFYIQNAGSGKYLYYGNNSGNNIYQTAALASAGIWAVTANGDSWTLQETASGRQLSCNRFGNPGSYYLGYASYTDTSSTSRALEFYKLGEGEAPVDPEPTTEPTTEPTAEPSTEPSTEPEPELTVPFSDGDQVVIYAPAYNKALSAEKTGYYNAGVDVTITGGVMSGYSETEVWTVSANDDGTYSFSNGGKNIGLADSFSSMDLDAVNDKWELTNLGDGLYNIKNTVRGNFMEWYASKNNWSTYASSYAATDDQFQISFYKVTGDVPTGGSGLAEGDEVVIYNVSAQGVLALQDGNEDSPSINSTAATVTDGKATAGNGGLIFRVEKNGEYYRFCNETYGYLCSNGTGNNAFYSLTASEDADWTLAEYNGGYSLESRTAKYNGKYSQFLEYYADSYKTYSMYNVTDADIYTFRFYPCANDESDLTGGIVNAPVVNFGSLAEAFAGSDYTFSFTVETVFELDGDLTVLVGEEELTANGDGSYTIPAELVSGEKLTVTVSGTDTTGRAFSAAAEVTVKDEPIITDVTPAQNGETGDDKRPEISAVIENAGENPTVTMTVGGKEIPTAVYADGKLTYQPDEDLADGTVSVTVTVVRADGKEASKTWRFTVGQAQYQLYFGQLHSHTTYSDGAGDLTDALNYIAGLKEEDNVDFVAFTDHSNYFDTTSAANPESALYDLAQATPYSQSTWTEYKDAIAAFNASQSDVVAIGGFEMTWSGGPGHINTFNTEGIVSRNNATLNNKTGDAGLKAYYALLSQAEGAESISQFNHPGSTFGTFIDFSYWDAVIDSRIQLVEVGNGEGQIGAGGYYPSYEYYTMALDKGWHVAPTNNQDNHKGKWGNANNARDVILTDDFSEDGIYEAIRNLRVYATEDKNLEIYYTVNGQQLGSIIADEPDALNVNVTVYDPDASDSISKVELIVNSGLTAYTWDDPAVLAAGELTATLDPTYSYYYVRVTQGDGDLAVTAPVWVGETLKLGVSSVESGTSTPVTGEELEITTTLFNSESVEATVKSITYTTNGSVVLGTDTTGCTIPASGTQAVTFAYTPDVAKVMTVTANVVVELDGIEYSFSKSIELDVQDSTKLVYIGIDASHYNEYVNGNYKDSMGNFGELAAEYGVRTVELKTSGDLIAACSNEKYKALILTAPSRRLAAAQEELLVYTDAELEAIAEFNANGGMVILAGWSDNYENYPVIQTNPDATHMAATQNAVLEALGSSLRISDDATYDDVRSAADKVDKWRLYFNTYGNSFLTEGVEVDEANPYDRLYTEVFSHYGGASVYAVNSDGSAASTLPETVIPVVYGHASTYSVDVDKDGLGGDIPKYAYADGDERLLVMASEQIPGKGLIIVSGAAFMSNFEVQATIEDSGSEKNYSNYKICENLLAAINPVETVSIATVQAQTGTGYKYTIEGIVTSNASGYDKDTAFFDCIYVQDETGGICCFPVAGSYQIGDRVRITGTTDFYQGEMELQVSSITVLSKGSEVKAREVTAAQINDQSVIGQLVTLNGFVESYEYSNGLIQTILVWDQDGNVARVFIDGYITTAEDVQNLEIGCAVSVTGLASYDNTFDGPAPRIRVRSRADVVCTAHTHTFTEAVTAATCVTEGYTEYTCFGCGYAYRDQFRTALDHDLGEPVVTAPTHDTMGYTTVKCGRDDCGYTYIYNYTSALGHSYTKTVTKEPTCSAEGEVTFSCTDCDSTYTMALPTTGHKCSATVIAPTCLTDGYTLYECENCDYAYIGAPTKATGHSYGEPVCQGNGYNLIECTACGHSYVEAHECLTAQYQDLKTTAWYHADTDAVLEAGIMNGTGANVFSPGLALTRAQAVTIVYRLAGEPEVNGKVPFTDVKSGSFYANAVAWGYATGVVKGLTDTEFGPGEAVTRQQMVAFLHRYAGAPAADRSILNRYTDGSQVSAYAAEAMSWALENGILNGTTATTLSPKDNAKRVQAAAIIHRFLPAEA